MTRLADIANELNRIGRVERMGGSETFFGRMTIFEDILHEEHTKAGLTEEGGKPGPYNFHGMEQYGNLVDFDPAAEACRRFVDEFNHDPQFLVRLYNWYEGRSPDCALLAICIKYFLKERGIEVEEQDE